jgi:uncharacterized protein YjdB
VLHAPVWGKGRRTTVWIFAAVVAACSSVPTDVVTTADVGSVSITPLTTTVRVGSQIPLQALVQDPGGKTIPGTEVFWSVQNPGIATISTAGVVTGVALGSTQVAASVNGKSGIATITVSPAAVATVTVTPNPLSMSVGQTSQLAATVKDLNGTVVTNRVVTWTTSDNSIVTLTQTAGTYSATVKGKKAGTATITATSEGKTGTTTVRVKP